MGLAHLSPSSDWHVGSPRDLDFQPPRLSESWLAPDKFCDFKVAGCSPLPPSYHSHPLSHQIPVRRPSPLPHTSSLIIPSFAKQTYPSQWLLQYQQPARRKLTPLSRTWPLPPQRSSPDSSSTPDSPSPVPSAVPSPTEPSHPSMCKLRPFPVRSHLCAREGSHLEPSWRDSIIEEM